MAIITRFHASNIRNRGATRACSTLAVLLVLLVCGVSSLWAAEELPQISTLNPVPELDPIPEFHVHGSLDEIRPEGLIVNDAYVEFPGIYETKYYRVSDRSQITLSGFQIGDYVGCELDSIGKLKTMWKYSQPPE